MTGNLKCCLGEFLGTFALVLFGAGAVCMDSLTGGKVGLVGTALAAGLTLTVTTWTYGPTSGGHFNPVLTLALLANKRIEPTKAVLYAASQLLGAACGGLLLGAVLHGRPELASAPVYLGAFEPSSVGFKAATLLEALGAFLLVSVFYATALDPRGNPAHTAPAVGLTLVLSVLAMGPVTGAALNPARAFGPAVASGHWADWYVYWIGPVAGALAAALIQEKIFLSKNRPS